MSLYNRIPGNRYIPLISDWPCISTAENVTFTAHFSETEIFSAIKALGKNKAPGQDGFTAEFLVKHWNLVKDSFQALFTELHENGKLNTWVQEKFICLIQRKEDAMLVKDFRPISLTILSYKVIAKVLAEKLKMFGTSFLFMIPFRLRFRRTF